VKPCTTADGRHEWTATIVLENGQPKGMRISDCATCGEPVPERIKQKIEDINKGIV
jgi:hypothetical protein